jgi:hypothetical protein
VCEGGTNATVCSEIILEKWLNSTLIAELNWFCSAFSFNFFDLGNFTYCTPTVCFARLWYVLCMSTVSRSLIT